jgi:hypothetical protein
MKEMCKEGRGDEISWETKKEKMKRRRRKKRFSGKFKELSTYEHFQAGVAHFKRICGGKNGGKEDPELKKKDEGEKRRRRKKRCTEKSKEVLTYFQAGVEHLPQFLVVVGIGACMILMGVVCMGGGTALCILPFGNITGLIEVAVGVWILIVYAGYVYLEIRGQAGTLSTAFYLRLLGGTFFIIGICEFLFPEWAGSFHHSGVATALVIAGFILVSGAQKIRVLLVPEKILGCLSGCSYDVQKIFFKSTNGTKGYTRYVKVKEPNKKAIHALLVDVADFVKEETRKVTKVTTTKADGSKTVVTNPTIYMSTAADGTVTTSSMDRKIMTSVAVDGSTTKTNVNADGSVTIAAADGSETTTAVVSNADGSTTATLPDGRTIRVSADGEAVTMISADGTTTVTTTWGSLTCESLIDLLKKSIEDDNVVTKGEELLLINQWVKCFGNVVFRSHQTDGSPKFHLVHGSPEVSGLEMLHY